MPQRTRYDHITISQRSAMSITQIFHENSQSMNDISYLSTKSEIKLQINIPKIKQGHVSNLEGVLAKLTRGRPYPNFRFFCPYCASLDVFITIDKNTSDLSVDCLDCKKIWVDKKFIQTEVSKKCRC